MFRRRGSQPYHLVINDARCDGWWRHAIDVTREGFRRQHWVSRNYSVTHILIRGVTCCAVHDINSWMTAAAPRDSLKVFLEVRWDLYELSCFERRTKHVVSIIMNPYWKSIYVYIYFYIYTYLCACLCTKTIELLSKRIHLLCCKHNH